MSPTTTSGSTSSRAFDSSCRGTAPRSSAVGCACPTPPCADGEHGIATARLSCKNPAPGNCRDCHSPNCRSESPASDTAVSAAKVPAHFTMIIGITSPVATSANWSVRNANASTGNVASTCSSSPGTKPTSPGPSTQPCCVARHENPPRLRYLPVTLPATTTSIPCCCPPNQRSPMSAGWKACCVDTALPCCSSATTAARSMIRDWSVCSANAASCPSTAPSTIPATTAPLNMASAASSASCSRFSILTTRFRTSIDCGLWCAPSSTCTTPDRDAVSAASVRPRPTSSKQARLIVEGNDTKFLSRSLQAQLAYSKANRRTLDSTTSPPLGGKPCSTGYAASI